MKKCILGCLLALLMVSTAMAGQDPYIAIVGNDCIKASPTDSVCEGNPFYVSPKYQQFMFNQEAWSIPVCSGTFPGLYNQTGRAIYQAGCEQFRPSTPTNQAEICDTLGEVGAVPPDRGNRNSVVRKAGTFEWYIRLPKTPMGSINLALQCGVLKPNAFSDYGYGSVEICAAETGEKLGFGTCTQELLDPGVQPLIIAGLPKITAIAYPGPYNSFVPFNLTAFKNPSSYSLAFEPAPGDGHITNNAVSQILDGSAGTRIVLKSCMDKTILVKQPVAGQLNAATGQVEADLAAGDFIYVKMDIPRQNPVDIYCHAQSLRVMGIGEPAF